MLCNLGKPFLLKIIQQNSKEKDEMATDENSLGDTLEVTRLRVEYLKMRYEDTSNSTKTASRLVYFVDGADIDVIERRGRLGLVYETLGCFIVPA